MLVLPENKMNKMATVIDFQRSGKLKASRNLDPL